MAKAAILSEYHQLHAYSACETGCGLRGSGFLSPQCSLPSSFLGLSPYPSNIHCVKHLDLSILTWSPCECV